MTGGLKIQLLGGFQITQEDKPLTGFTNTRLQAVLAYLILSRATPQARQQLAYLFWPDSTDGQARTNLRNILHLLRNHLPDAEACLLIDSLTIQWRSDAPAAIDVVDFDSAMAIAQSAHDDGARCSALEGAVALYSGDLLPNCYDEWIAPVREEWQQRYLSTGEQLIDLLEQRRNYRQALEHAQRLLQYDPLLETTYGRLMQLHAALGDRAAALRIYHLCRSTLDRELGVEPSPTTQAIYERLLKLETSLPVIEPARLAAPLVGRDQVWGELQRVWQRGNAKLEMIFVAGEAGIGKTRLVDELIAAVSRQGTSTASAYCYPAGGRLAYAPIQNWLRAPDIQRHLSKLSAPLRLELVRLLPELSTPDDPLFQPSPMTETAQRRRLFEAMLHALTVGNTPLLLLLDDIQWCDGDTLDWLAYLIRNKPSTHILIVATLRSGEMIADDPLYTFRLQLERIGALHDIPLTRLTYDETSKLVFNLIGRQPTKGEAESIFRETEGNPLFIVETVRAEIDRQGMTGADAKDTPMPGLSGASGRALPPKIQSVIEARLVRLSPEARNLVDVAAVVGSAFTTDLLTAVTGADEDALVQGLDELWQQQLIREHGGRVLDAYDFVHDKLREVVYNTLSPMRRRLVHRRVAVALEELSARRAESIGGQIALHHEAAGQMLQAIQWYQRAAQRAHRSSALQEALAHLDHALHLLATLSDATVSDQEIHALELTMQVQRATLFLVTKGHAAPQVEQALTRALALSKIDGTPQQRFAVLWGLGRYYLVRPDLDKGLAVSEQLLQLAEASQNLELLVEAYTAMGTYHLHRAAFQEALDYLGRAISLYDRTVHGNHTIAFGQDPGVVSLSYRAWTHWCLGQTEEAQEQTKRALALADELGYPYNQTVAKTYAAVQLQYMDDAAGCLRQAEEASTLATAQGFILWQAMADFLRGWSLTRLEKPEEGMALMLASAELYRATGAELGACYFAALLAETLGRLGQTAQGIETMERAFALLNRTHDQWCAAELHRIQGDLLLQLTGDDEMIIANQQAARDAFTTGLQIAQEQGAVWWEERCQQSLATLDGPA